MAFEKLTILDGILFFQNLHLISDILFSKNITNYFYLNNIIILIIKKTLEIVLFLG